MADVTIADLTEKASPDDTDLIELDDGLGGSFKTSKAQLLAALQAQVTANTNANSGSVTVHSDVTSAGSGQIITASERSAITANTAKVSADGSVTTHNDVTDAGSGAIITAAERTTLGTALQPGANITELNNNAGYISSVNEDTAPALGGDLGTGSEALYITLTAGETIAAGDVVRASATPGEILRADATSEANASTAVGVALTGGAAAASIDVAWGGIVAITGVTPGSVYFLSATPGEIVSTAPAVTGQIVRQIGVAVATNQLLLVPGAAWVEVA